jgi:hypothetical protein
MCASFKIPDGFLNTYDIPAAGRVMPVEYVSVTISLTRPGGICNKTSSKKKTLNRLINP